VRVRALRALRLLDPAAQAAAARGLYEGDPSNFVRASALGVLARSGAADVLPLLVDATRPGQPGLVRQTAAFSLARFHAPEAAAALERLTAPGEDRNNRVGALNLLPQQGDTARAVTLATRYLDDPDALFAASAVRVLAHLGGAPARALLLQRLAKEPRVRVRSAIEEVLRP
jgi:HEAT repeat protein